MSTKTESELKMALMSTGMVQPLTMASTNNRVSCIARQIPGHEKRWLMLTELLLKEAAKLDVDLNIGKRYVLKDDAMAFGVFFSVEAKNAKKLSEALTSLTDVLGRPVDSLPDPVQPPSTPAAAFSNKPKLDLSKFTTAHPRPPGVEAPVQTPPDGFTPQLVVVESRLDDNGRPVIVQEMPLPHVYGEMNRPNDKGKGASKSGSNL